MSRGPDNFQNLQPYEPERTKKGFGMYVEPGSGLEKVVTYGRLGMFVASTLGIIAGGVELLALNNKDFFPIFLGVEAASLGLLAASLAFNVDPARMRHVITGNGHSKTNLN